MPTSSQALILLNSELDSSLGLYSSRVQRAVTSTAGLMLSSLAISVSQGQISTITSTTTTTTTNTTTTTTTTTATNTTNDCCNATNNFKDNGTVTLATATSFNTNTRYNDNQQGDSSQKDGVWLPRSSCPINLSVNHTHPISDSVQYRSLGRASGCYHYRQPLILSSRPYHGQISHDRCQQIIATPRHASEEVWPVLEVRKSQQFYRPLQSLHVGTSAGDLLLAHSNPRQDASPSEATSTVTQPTFSPLNRRLIQRLRELGFRSRSSKGQHRNVGNGIAECGDEMPQPNEGVKKKLHFNVGTVLRKSGKGAVIVSPETGDKDNVKDVSSISMLSSLFQQNPETNGHGQLLVKNSHFKKDDQPEKRSESMMGRQLQDDGEENLERDKRTDREADAAEREKVDQLVAQLQAGLRQRKYKPPSIRMRKELPETRPLAVCFGCGSDVHISHEEIKRELESQYPDVSIISLQFDPVSVNVGDPTTRNRWIVTLSRQDDCQTMIKGGVLLTGGERVTVRPLDDVMKEEHKAYKLHQYVQEAKTKVSLMKDDPPRKHQKSKHKGKPKKKKIAVK